MRLTVLGCSGTHPGPQRMCSSYLVEHQGYRLLLDCGNGSLSNLLRTCELTDLDAVVISHLHPDHFADLYGLYYGLRFHPAGPQRLTIHAPEGAHAFVTQLLPGDAARTFADHCPMEVARAGDRLDLGPFAVTLFAAEHPVETLASRVEADAHVLAYSADSAPTDELTRCARDADLFVCDASWLERDGPHPAGVHMTGADAGCQAAQAAARRLLATHVFPSNDPEQVAAEARERFDGDVLVAHDLDVIDLS